METANNRWRGLVAALPLAMATAAVTAAAGSPDVPAGEDFGAGITLTEIADFGDVVAEPEKYAGAAVLLHGRISDVCQRRGCWLVLRDGDDEVQIRFADYGFFVPKDCRGKQAYVEGQVKAETLSERDARHYALESIDGDPDAIHGPQKIVSFIATGVRIVSKD